MTRHVAFLRAINLPNHGKVPMAGLRAFFLALGFPDAQTLLQTGNVVFDADDRPTTDLESLLQSEEQKRLSLSTDFMVRSADEIRAIVEANPFPDQAKSDPGHLVVAFLKETPPPGAVAALQSASKGPEVVSAHGRELYIVYPDGIGRSKLTGSLMDSKLRTRGTGRNWNTVLKLRELTA